MCRLRLLFNKLRKKYYGRMMVICLDRYCKCERWYWFIMFKKYFDKLYEDKDLQMISCTVNKMES